MANPAARPGQVYISGWQKRLITSRLLPRAVLLAVASAAAHIMRRRIGAADRREAEQVTAQASAADRHLYFADIYHGGATFWDWIVLRGGGLWWRLLWPLVVETTVERLCAHPELRAVLELDAHTYEELEGSAGRRNIMRLRAAIAAGRLEVANGTYAQPLASTIGSEANLRHFFYGLNTIERVLGARVDSFVAGEPQFFLQLPQVLAGCGVQQAVFRTHWAPFGTDPVADADIVRWQGPDGSQVRTVPRYSCMDYELMKEGHPGVQNAGLTGDDFERWPEERAAQFAAQAARVGVARAFLTRLADPKPPESPFPKLLTAAHRPTSRLISVREYFDLPRGNEPRVAYGIDDIPSTIPWGLAGEQLHRDQVQADSALLIAERLDAVVQSMGMAGHQAQLDRAWKLLLRAQHHDLHLCSPWHSTRHRRSMGEVGCDFARQATHGAQTVAAAALESLALRYGRTGRGRSFLLFNPSPWPRQELVQLPADSAAEVWQGGRPLLTQWIASAGGGAVGFVAQLPPLGVDLVELRPAPQQANPAATAPVALPGAFDPLAREFDSAIAGAFLTVWHEGGDRRSATEGVEVEQDGPLFRRYRVHGRLLDLSFTQAFTAIPSLRRMQVTTDIDFGHGRHLGPQLSDHEPERAYYIQDERKLCLNFRTHAGSPFCDAAFLLAEPRGPRFTALSFAGVQANAGTGLAVFHKGTPGWHFAGEDGVLRNVLAWGPEQWLYASDDSVTPGRSRYTAVRGLQRYEHAVASVGSRLEAMRAAQDFRLPVMAVDVPDAAGRAGGPWSFLNIAPEHVILTALFARDGHTYARLWNAGEQSTVVTRPSAAVAVSLRLEEERPSAWPHMRPWGIQTVRLAGA